MTEQERQAALDALNKIENWVFDEHQSDEDNDFVMYGSPNAFYVVRSALLTKTAENVTCENLSNVDEISLKNWVFAWAADVKGTPLDSDINDLIWVIEKHIKEQAALQSTRVPVIEGLDEAIASCVRYPMVNEIGFLTTADRDNVLKAARAYAELQKVV